MYNFEEEKEAEINIEELKTFTDNILADISETWQDIKISLDEIKL